MSTQAYDKDGNKIPFAVYKGDIVRGFQTVEQYEAQIASLTAENERLRHHLEVMIDTAEDRMPAQRPSIPHDYEPYDRDLADIAAARAALQHKEGE